MEAVVNYFTHISSAHRSLLLVGGLTLFFIIESAVPLFKWKFNRTKHTLINVFFTLTTILVNFTMAFIMVAACDFVVAEKIGFFQMIEMPLWLTVIGGLLLFDLVGAWLPHWTEHKVKWMWKFHLIHHTDQHVSTTTANRHHPGESVIRFVFTTIAILVLGAPIWLVFFYQALSVVSTQFNHSNVKMPKGIDSMLSYAIVTPNMHRIHHHYRQPYSDTNYGNIFSLWDRLFGTHSEADNSQLVYGVDTHMEHNEANDVLTLLKIPFMKYRQPIQYDNEEVLSK